MPCHGDAFDASGIGHLKKMLVPIAGNGDTAVVKRANLEEARLPPVPGLLRRLALHDEKALERTGNVHF